MGNPLSEETIRKQLRSEALQHPTTILPFALCILAIIYLVFYAEVLGGTLGAIALVICSTVVAIGSFSWRYFFRYSETYERRVREIVEQQDRAQREKEQADTEHLLDVVQTGFSQIHFAEGLWALKGLVYEHEQLRHVLERKVDIGLLSTAHLSDLAEETYRQGLRVLADVLAIDQVILSSDKERLEEAIAALEREIRALEESDAEGSLAKIKRATMASHRERFDMIGRQELRVGKLLYQCDRCEASLHRTRIELAALKRESSEMSISAVTETLQATICQAREVQEELRKLGF
jgi:hypothetical protein